MPIDSPPPAIPVYIPKPVQHEQKQSDVNINDNASTDITSSPSYNNSSVLGGTLTNQQFNYDGNGYVQGLGGTKLPIANFNVSYFNSYADEGVVATLSIPVDIFGNSKKVKRQMDAQSATIENNLVVRKLEACANISEHFLITDYSALNLDECKYLEKRTIAKAPVDEYKQSIKEMQAQIASMQQIILKQNIIIERVYENNQPPFTGSRG